LELENTQQIRTGKENTKSIAAQTNCGDEKVGVKGQQHDEDADSSKTGCRSPSRAHGKAYEQVPAWICDS